MAGMTNMLAARRSVGMNPRSPENVVLGGVLAGISTVLAMAFRHYRYTVQRTLRVYPKVSKTHRQHHNSALLRERVGWSSGGADLPELHVGHQRALRLVRAARSGTSESSKPNSRAQPDA